LRALVGICRNGSLAVLVLLAAAAPAQAGLILRPGPAGFDAGAVEAGGEPASEANSHPFALRFHIGLDPSSEDFRDLSMELPPGLFANPTALPRCSQAQFNSSRTSPYEASQSGESCPDGSQLGTITVSTPGTTRTFGLFNLAPGPGRLALFGANPHGSPILFAAGLRAEGGRYRLSLTADGLSQATRIEEIELDLWGAPWLFSHDGQRGNCLNEAQPQLPWASCSVSQAERQLHSGLFITLPTSCAEPPSYRLVADGWGHPGLRLPDGDPDPADSAWTTAAAIASAPLQGCESLGGAILASALPGSQLASSPTGLTVFLSGSEAQTEELEIALPEGVTINPSVGAGLAACSEAQFAAETASSAPGAGCPNPSKIGRATLETPLVEGQLQGGLFIATPFANPFGAPYALYFIARSAERGMIVKVAGRLDADQKTGQLRAVFKELPQLPYSNLKVEFREGQRAPLVTPPACGSYATKIALRSWSRPDVTFSAGAVTFPISKGSGGGPCPSAAAPFAPQATAGTVNSRAGGATSFYLHLTRTDVEQEITSYSTQLPPGLLGSIAGIPFCPDGAIEAAKHRSGLAEAAGPSCPAASEIGHTYTGFGAGLAPAYSAGRLYLAGPFHGAPLSVVAINPAVVGPFDLGTIVIRSAIQIDPHTAQVTIDSSASDPIPHIFAGIPLRLRDIRVYIDRPGFMINPTSCVRRQIVSTLTGSDVPFADPRSATATATVPFQPFDCSSLGFRPKLSLAAKGKPRRGGYQQLRVTVTPRAGDANIAGAAVILPPSLFLAQNHIRTICTKGQSASDTCPAAAVIGRAAAQTPLLSEALEGPVYLRSSDNPLPDLVTVLRGSGGIRIVLECRIDSSHGGLRGRCENLPDAPVTRFTMTIFGGRRGILQSAENLCREPQIGATRLLGQANLGWASRPRLSVRCGRRKARTAKHSHGPRRRGSGS
jgi:hypothetical protein